MIHDLRLTRDQLDEALAIERHDHNATRRAFADLDAQIQRARVLLMRATETAHHAHHGHTDTCLRGVCVDLRKARAAL